MLAAESDDAPKEKGGCMLAAESNDAPKEKGGWVLAAESDDAPKAGNDALAEGVVACPLFTGGGKLKAPFCPKGLLFCGIPKPKVVLVLKVGKVIWPLIPLLEANGSIKPLPDEPSIATLRLLACFSFRAAS